MRNAVGRDAEGNGGVQGVMSGAVGGVVTIVRDGARVGVMEDAVDGDAAVDTHVTIVRVVARVRVLLQGEPQAGRTRVELGRRANLQWVVERRRSRVLRAEMLIVSV